MIEKYRKTFKRDALECVSKTVEWALWTTGDTLTDDDKLLHCTLAEIKRLVDKKLVDVRPQYTISFSPAHAFALRIVFVDYIGECTSHRGNIFHTIANEVNQQYT